MNPAYPPQPYQPPTAPPAAYTSHQNAGQPPPIGFNPSLYAPTQLAYASTPHYPTAAHPTVQPQPQPSPYPVPATAQAPAYVAAATVPYNVSGAYTPNQPTYIQQQPPASNLTVIQPPRTVYVANPAPSAAVDSGLGFLAGAALGAGLHHHHHGYGHHSGFGHRRHHHGAGHHGFGHHGHHC